MKQTPLKRKSRLRPRKRTASEYARIYGSRERVRWIKSLQCVACVGLHPIFVLIEDGVIHNAHTVGGGTGRKAGYETIVPFCPSHHKRYDEHHMPFDSEANRAAMKLCAARIQALWLETTQHG